MSVFLRSKTRVRARNISIIADGTYARSLNTIVLKQRRCLIARGDERANSASVHNESSNAAIDGPAVIAVGGNGRCWGGGEGG